jgi:hypothetical protein
MTIFPSYSGGNIFAEPVAPSVTGYQFVKFAAVAFISIYLLKQLGSAFSK